ncbi:MAG: transcription-repair coupling factor [Epulopiscium sp. Nele67-Bin005]|nr:MAG: transcription-repair coupling factor [Epulopiscium sp. Nele67-Bin005]
MEIRKLGLVEPFKQLPQWGTFIEKLKTKNYGTIVGTVDACKSHLIYGICAETSCYPIIITHNDMEAKNIFEDMQFLYGEENVYLYPSKDILFYDADVHSMDITAERMRVINALIGKKDSIVIMSVEALLNPLSTKEVWQSYHYKIKEGDVVDIDKLTHFLLEVGYERVAKVEAIGQFAVRGGIVDIYSPTYIMPYRMELWDNEIDSIRRFNPLTQRSIDKIEYFTIYPNQEIIVPAKHLANFIPEIKEDLENTVRRLNAEGNPDFAERIEDKVKENIEQMLQDGCTKGLEMYIPYTDIKTSTLIDYIPKDRILCIDELTKCQEKYERTWTEYATSMKDRLEHGHILPKQLEFVNDYEKLWYQLDNFTCVGMMNFATQSEILSRDNEMILRIYDTSNNYKSLDLLQKDLDEWQNSKKSVLLLAGIKAKAERIVYELEERGIFASYSNNLEEMPHKGQILISKGSFHKGFVYEDIGFVVVADKSLFGQEKTKRQTKKKYKGTKIESFLELEHGDYVVHESHGIGVFQGIEQIEIEGISRDNLKIQYADGATLYVNINQMDVVQKYVGSETKSPNLSKLGTSEWKKSKAKVKGAVADIAKDLIKLYSKREHERGFIYQEDTLWQKEFEEMFPYSETQDQLDAIRDVKQDMESDKIMDRLICGDVGYGKTEVAIRATFKAVMNEKQVAYLVPTTILAQQHYQRFVERMEAQGISVGLLSRFRTAKQIKETLKALENGMLDIVIGTHRLLSKDVKFANVGLIIIDEEQRFGVRHKEKLKELRTEVDVLTLTATPIPRTLHMSLVGIRDMSLLEEAPLERKAVQTYVMEYSDDFIKDAIFRELNREGQVYFLHNKVVDIEEKALYIQNMVPNANVAFAHGQMSEKQLENIMMSFMNKEIDILVCTTIIETGLDISNANTIIINDADKMGLSQLYQLRGRVGRSSRTAYAYLMYKKDKVLKEVAEKRLQAIKQFTQLGAGFKIAMRDLEIRGAGNLLGAKQHGHMEAIGYDLYSKMLREAIAIEQGETVVEKIETTIELKINAFIPSSYINNEMQRLDIYKRIASIADKKDAFSVEEEIEDRYGEIPQTVRNIIDIALIKSIANSLGIILISQQPQFIQIKFKEDISLEPMILQELAQQYNNDLKFVFEKNIIIQAKITTANKKKLLPYIRDFLNYINSLKNVPS